MESPFSEPVPAGTRLIETFGWYPDTGIPRLARHLSRLAASAEVLGFSLDGRLIEALLVELGGAQPLRCRLSVGADGAADLATSELGSGSARSWRVALATERVASRDPWLRHKTSNRALYDRARATLLEGVDEVIFLNERNEICEGSITNIFVTLKGGDRVTPALTSGCLPGILRQEMLDTGEIEEAVITRDMLVTAEAFHLCNALRGILRGVLVAQP